MKTKFVKETDPSGKTYIIEGTLLPGNEFSIKRFICEVHEQETDQETQELADMLLKKLNNQKEIEVGDIFEHPVKDTGKTVKLVAVRGDVCDNCIFKGITGCESSDIGKRRHDITGSCSLNGVIYQLYNNKS